MYTRMLMVSAGGSIRRQPRAAKFPAAVTTELLAQARTELYAGSATAATGTAPSGGLYLPHLRQAVYRHLIAADNLLDQRLRPAGGWVESAGRDFNLDARQS